MSEFGLPVPNNHGPRVSLVPAAKQTIKDHVASSRVRDPVKSHSAEKPFLYKITPGAHFSKGGLPCSTNSQKGSRNLS